MIKSGFHLLVPLCLSVLIGTGVAIAQDEPATLSTDDVMREPESVTAAAAAESAVPADADAAVVAGTASDGYTKVIAPGGYTFERPDKWVQVKDLQSNNTPSYLRYDAVYQDPTTGAVLSAISVDRAQVSTPIDIADQSTITSLLMAMLNPSGAKEGAKLFKTTTGTGPNGSRWLRVKAQGQGQSVDGKAVETVYWVQFLQTDTLLALVAVGYPTGQQDVVGEAAFHTVRTLEIANARGPAATDTGTQPQSDGSGPETKEDGPSSMRK